MGIVAFFEKVKNPSFAQIKCCHIANTKQKDTAFGHTNYAIKLNVINLKISH